MRVLVTGGTGYLGRAIVRALDAHGHDVVLFSRRAREAGPPGLAIDGDVRDVAAFSRAAEGCDALIHAAGMVSIWQSHRDIFTEVNVGGLEHAIAARRHAGLHRLVYTSSFMALPPAGYDRPLAANDYQRTKADALRLARRSIEKGAPIVVLIPGVVYGPGVRSEGNLVGRLLSDHLAGALPGIVGGGRTWSFAFAEDVAAAHVAALDAGRDGAEFGVGGENRPQRAIFEWLERRTGRARPRELPSLLASAAGLVEECRARLTGNVPLVTRGAVEIFRHDWPVDSSAAVRELDYRIRPLEEGLEATMADLAPTAGPGRSAGRKGTIPRADGDIAAEGGTRVPPRR
jgi:nucleoside-diphosphate-sugar epimerase